MLGNFVFLRHLRGFFLIISLSNIHFAETISFWQRSLTRTYVFYTFHNNHMILYMEISTLPNWLYVTVSPINWSTMDQYSVSKMLNMRAIFVQTKITLEMTQNISTSSISYRMIPRFEIKRLSLSYARALTFAYSSGVPGALSPFFNVVFTNYFAFTSLCHLIEYIYANAFWIECREKTGNEE